MGIGVVAGKNVHWRPRRINVGRAFGALDGRLPSAPMKQGARDQINMGLGAATLGATGAIVMGAPQVGTGRVCYK